MLHEEANILRRWSSAFGPTEPDQVTRARRHAMEVSMRRLFIGFGIMLIVAGVGRLA